MSASKTNRSTTPAWLIAIRPSGSTRTVEAFLSNGTDQQETDDQHHRAGYAMNCYAFRPPAKTPRLPISRDSCPSAKRPKMTTC